MYQNFYQNQSFQNPYSYNSYNPNVQQQYINTQNQQNNTSTNIIPVKGIEEARAFQLSPNSSIMLVDADNNKLYVKSTDNLGVPKIDSYVFKQEEISESESAVQDKVVNTNDEILKLFDETNKRITDLENKVKLLSNNSSYSTNGEEDN